jgi:LPXTG-motif cell wall-anchored protein
MKNSARVVVTVLSSVAVLGLVLAGATPATAASGNSGVGGGAYAGDTLHATAWETAFPGLTVTSSPVIHTNETDVYSYRIGISDEAIVDYQATTGLEELTAAEQEQWYVDAGFAPYEFDWYVFYCAEVTIGTALPSVMNGDTGANVAQVVYRDVSSQPTFPTMQWNEYSAWLDSLSMGTAFEPEIDATGGNYYPWFRTVVGTDFLAPDDSPTFSPANLAASYIDLQCPSGLPPARGRILNSSSYDDYAVGRTLNLGSTIYFQDLDLAPLAIPDVYEVSSPGVYIGVTGSGFQNNAALWGLTYVNAGARALPDTGVDSGAMWAWASGAGALALAGMILVRIRRHIAR